MRRGALLILISVWPIVSAGEPRERFETEGVQIAGTTWTAEDGPLGIVTYFFDKNGQLVYTYANGSEYRNGTWKQDGQRLYFEANRGFREFQATISPTKIVGKSWNKGGNAWTTTLTLKRR